MVLCDIMSSTFLQMCISMYAGTHVSMYVWSKVYISIYISIITTAIRVIKMCDRLWLIVCFKKSEKIAALIKLNK